LIWYKHYIVILILVLFVLVKNNVNAQDSEVELSKTEVLIGLDFNTNGGFLGGVMGQYGIKKSALSYHTIGLEVVNIKHHQEVRVSSMITGNSFLFGKQNYLFSIRPHYGVQWVVFPATRDDGVQVNIKVAGGFSIGIVKPYYIKFNYSKSSSIGVVKEEAFDPYKHQDANNILGHGNNLKGFGESKITPGLHLKSSVLFYFGNYGRRISGLEAGGMLEGFFHKGPNGFGVHRVNIIPYTKNNWLFSSLYLNVFLGWRK
jgi:hypothetical protein